MYRLVVWGIVVVLVVYRLVVGGVGCVGSLGNSWRGLRNIVLLVFKVTFCVYGSHAA